MVGFRKGWFRIYLLPQIFELMLHNNLMKRSLLLLTGCVLILLIACSTHPQAVTPSVSPSPFQTASSSKTLAPTRTQTPLPKPTSTYTVTPEPGFSFVVTSDMSLYSAREYFDYPNFFAAALRYVAQFGPGDFMVSLGDILPAEDTSWTVDQVLGEDYPWFPLPGNHDFSMAEINFFRNYQMDINGDQEPNIINWGPESCPDTTYSFDFQNAHFVALNVYCDEEVPWGIDGSITDTVYDWLAADLDQTQKDHIFVFGHEPAFPRPDSDTGQIRHLGDSLDQYPQARDRFWGLLKDKGVIAYIHGHTHGYNAEKIDGVWQLNAGQSMGVRAAPSPGTFLIISVNGSRVNLQTYRGEEGPGFSYLLRDEISLSK